jgi:hypothetical protein
LETWYDWLAFVLRHQLGKIIPMIGDRRFASIVQKFLHEYGEITIDHIGIVAPYEEDPDGPHLRVRTYQNNCPLRFEMAAAQMPANIKSFHFFKLRFALGNKRLQRRSPPNNAFAPPMRLLLKI